MLTLSNPNILSPLIPGPRRPPDGTLVGLHVSLLSAIIPPQQGLTPQPRLSEARLVMRGVAAGCAWQVLSAAVQPGRPRLARVLLQYRRFCLRPLPSSVEGDALLTCLYKRVHSHCAHEGYTDVHAGLGHCSLPGLLVKHRIQHTGFLGDIILPQ